MRYPVLFEPCLEASWTPGWFRILSSGACQYFHRGVLTLRHCDIATIVQTCVSSRAKRSSLDARCAGVLVLSEFAGAAQSLGAGAILVNPWNITDVAAAIQDALTMSEQVLELPRLVGLLDCWSRFRFCAVGIAKCRRTACHMFLSSKTESCGSTCARHLRRDSLAAAVDSAGCWRRRDTLFSAICMWPQCNAKHICDITLYDPTLLSTQFMNTIRSGGSGTGKTTCTSPSTPARRGRTPSSASSTTRTSRRSSASATSRRPCACCRPSVFDVLLEHCWCPT